MASRLTNQEMGRRRLFMMHATHTVEGKAKLPVNIDVYLAIEVIEHGRIRLFDP